MPYLPTTLVAILFLFFLETHVIQGFQATTRLAFGKRVSLKGIHVGQKIPDKDHRHHVPPIRQTPQLHYHTIPCRRRTLLSSVSQDSEEHPVIVGVVTPLRYLGPYPGLSLRFPHLRHANGTQVVWNFVLDTGANTNSLHSRLVQDWNLPLLFRTQDLPIVGSAGIGGSFAAGDIHQLGDCQLEGLPPGQNFTFMTNLTASSLTHASPHGDGLLSISFFQSFPAGVEWDWHGTDGDPPTLIFYFGKHLPSNVRHGLTPIPLQRLPIQVFSMNVTLHDDDDLVYPALLDTGAPMTVLSPQAARDAGIELVERVKLSTASEFQRIGDPVLTIRGVDGGVVDLYRSLYPIEIGATGAPGDPKVSLGSGYVYVGELPGLSLISGLTPATKEPPPAIILGMDSLSRTYRMVLQAPYDTVWFEELPET